MILVDANLMIYAVNADAPLHKKAKSWLESSLSGRETIGFSWNVLLAFLRLSTRSGLFRHPLSVDNAFYLMASGLDEPPATIVYPGPRHLSVLRELLPPLDANGTSHRTHTGYLGHLFLRYHFARFSGLKWRNPLS